MTRIPHDLTIGWSGLFASLVLALIGKSSGRLPVAAKTTSIDNGDHVAFRVGSQSSGLPWLVGDIARGKQLETTSPDLDGDKEEWKNWNTPPPSNSTGNLIFNSASGLLQHWHNTRYRNGHTVILGTIEKGTLLYHGRYDGTPPREFEWLSFDPEHSYFFCRYDGHMVTYAATRPLKILYLDGESAAKMDGGPMDSQQIIVHGKVGKLDLEPTWGEYRRIRDLCKWGEQYGLDGFVRMEMDFEVMYCDLTQGLRVVSNLKLVTAVADGGMGRLPTPPPPRPSPPSRAPHPTHISGTVFQSTRPIAPPGWVGSLRTFQSVYFEAIQAGIWHDRRPGVNGVKLDYSRMTTFYNSRYQSLQKARGELPRNKHRLVNITTEDAATFADELKDVLTRKGGGSGVAWDASLRTVVERYSQRVEYLRFILNSSGTTATVADATATAKKVRQHVLMMLSPYILWSAVPLATATDRWANTTWLSEPMRHCSTSFTSSLDIATLTLQEKLLYEAVEQTVREICRTLGIIWVDAFAVESAGQSETQALVDKWRTEVNRLMDWLDWGDWVRCDPACGPKEVCTFPQWPFTGPTGSEEETTPFCMTREYLGAAPPWR